MIKICRKVSAYVIINNGIQLRKDLLPDDCPAVAIEDVPFILFLHNVYIIFSLEKTHKKTNKI